jgi:hypothetical protein
MVSWKAYRALADAGYAPELFVCQEIQGRMMMVIMKSVDY